MNKRKIIAALLASACVTAGALALTTGAGCKQTEADRDARIVAVYNLYADNAKANGETVLSYDEWLATIKGADGKDGKDGKDGIDGNAGTDGNNGKSAYEIAVENGFKGTEKEWLESLKGSQGEPGKAGDKGDTGSKGDQGASVVSVKQITDKWGICSYFEFTLSDGSTIDTSATPMITVDRDKDYPVNDEEEKQLLIGYGALANKIIIRPITGIDAYEATIYIDEPEGFMDRVYIYEIEKPDAGGYGVSLSEVVYYGGKVDVSAVKLDTVGDYKVTGTHRGIDFELTVKVTERALESIYGYPTKIEVQQVEQGGINDFIRGLYVDFRYTDGSSKQMSISYILENGGEINFQNITPAVGVYPVNGTYNNIDFTVPVVVIDVSMKKSVLAVIPDDDYSYFIGVEISEILDMRCRLFYTDGDNGYYSLTGLNVTEEAFANVDLTTAGVKTLTFEYEGVECEVKFEIKEVELLYTFTGTDTTSQLALAGTPVTQIKVYNNETAELTLDGAEAMTAEVMANEGLLLIMKQDGEDIYYMVFTYDLSDKDSPVFANITLADVEELGTPEGATYTGTVDEKAVTVKLYGEDGEGIAFYTVDGKTYGLMYMQQGNMLMLAGAGMFTVNTEDNTIEPVIMP